MNTALQLARPWQRPRRWWAQRAARLMGWFKGWLMGRVKAWPAAPLPHPHGGWYV
jgi:hypothetical protein